MGRYPPLTCAQVKSILKNLGFEQRPQKGTSHEHWVKYDADGNLLGKVTVDCPKAPFSKTLIKFMASQAGVTKKAFYQALSKK